MKKFLCGILAILTLTACDNTTSPEPKVPTKDDMVRYYDKMSDNEIQQVFKSQNIGRCLAEFQSQHIPNAQNACDCIMDKTIQKTSMSDLRQMLLPAEYVSSTDMHEITARSAFNIQQATMECIRQ